MPRCTLAAAPGAPAAATPAMGEEDYYLELCERPVHFEKANPVNCVFFDEANKQVRARRLLPRGPAPGVGPRAGLLPGTRPGASCRPDSGREPAPRVDSAEEPGFTAAVTAGWTPSRRQRPGARWRGAQLLDRWCLLGAFVICVVSYPCSHRRH